MKLRITENDNENYTGHVLKFTKPSSLHDCKGAEIELIRSRGNLYAVTFSRRNICEGEGEFEFTDQTLNGAVKLKGQLGRVKIHLTKLGAEN